MVNRLVRESGEIDIYIVTGDQIGNRTAPGAVDALRPVSDLKALPGRGWRGRLGHGGEPADPALVGYRAVALVLLLAVSLLALFIGRGPMLVAAALSALMWDFLFIPPRFTLTISA